VARRRFTKEFKISAVQLVNQRQMSLREAAQQLGVSISSLRFWQRKHQDDPALGGVRNAPDLHSENRRLREENARLRLEREILKKATAFFAREQ
jgi:transposase